MRMWNRLDEKMIESLFGYNLQTTMKNDEAKSKSPSPSKHVLEPKRLQNITILSKALNATAVQVCDALQQGKTPPNLFRIKGFIHLNLIVENLQTSRGRSVLTTTRGIGQDGAH